MHQYVPLLGRELYQLSLVPLPTNCAQMATLLCKLNSADDCTMIWGCMCALWININKQNVRYSGTLAIQIEYA